ncbi:MAG: 50S ribosomal protein L4 [Elusimicrobiota bacterium]|jgi:large subunit ribosomal protein L4|nr:50S ribosomal protein L4 [Elusimicrobiota bacterium]
METKLLNIKGKEQGRVSLPENLFGKKPNPTFLHEVITAYLSNQRAGSADVKTRAEVSGTGKKPWKQKGTGRARHGSMRSPIWRHGGVAFGPTPRSFRIDLPAAKKRLALAHALSAKFLDDGIIIVDKLDIKEAKTKEVAAALKNLSAGRKPLVVANREPKLLQAGRNITGMTQTVPSDLNAYVVLNSSKVIFTKEALEKMVK